MVSEKHRRLLREQRERKEQRRHETAHPAVSERSGPQPAVKHKSAIHRVYHDHYKPLLLFTLSILLVSLLVIGHTYVTTGDVLYKGVSLSGGITIGVSTTGLNASDIKTLEDSLRTVYPDNDVSVREISELGTQQGFSIEATTKTNTRESLDELSQGILNHISADIPDVKDRASVEATGPALGASFFQQTIKAILIAFVFMGLVVFLYFGERLWQKIVVFILSITEAFLIWYAASWALVLPAVVLGAALVILYTRYSIPSAAVILAAASTILFTIAVVDLLQMRISTAGIAAFLMLVGYSVDTDILLSTRVLKSTTGTVYERIVGTMKTGITMTGTTFAAAVVSLIFTQSAVIREIMLIIAIGLVADIFNTWVQNSGILRWHLETKGRRSDSA
jgi:preprotein translocase subunit SecF